jgi:hypothetical protein
MKINQKLTKQKYFFDIQTNFVGQGLMINLDQTNNPQFLVNFDQQPFADKIIGWIIQLGCHNKKFKELEKNNIDLK